MTVRATTGKAPATQPTKSAASPSVDRAPIGQSDDLNSIQFLQRTAGNQAVRQLLQSKFKSSHAASNNTIERHLGRNVTRVPRTKRIMLLNRQDSWGRLQRTPAEAEALIDSHTSWFNLDESALGRELLRLALGGQLTLADEVLNELGSTNRDDVALEFMLAAADEQLVRLASATGSRQLLHRLFDELTSGSVADDEQEQADRILQVTTRQSVAAADFDEAALSRRTKIFPFRLPGFTVFNDAPIEARRERGGVWVKSFVRVLGTAEFRAETATLPDDYFLGGIVLPETEVIGVRLYDQGGILHYTTPLFLIQLANASDQRVLEKILEAAGIGLTLGSGALAGLGVEASMAARVLLWADRAAFVLGTLTSILREHRAWLVEKFGSGFMDAVDIVHSATAIYGLARVAVEAPRIIFGLRSSYRALRETASRESAGFSSGERATIEQVTQNTDELINQIDNIQEACPTARPGAAEPETPPTAVESSPAEAPPASASEGGPAPLGSTSALTPTQTQLLQRAREFFTGHDGAVGALLVEGEGPMFIKSGEHGGPWGGTHRGGIPRGRGYGFTSGGPSQGNIATHVEGHASAIMWQRGLRRATLIVDRQMCLICGRDIPSSLPPGAELIVITAEEGITILRSPHAL